MRREDLQEKAQQLRKQIRKIQRDQMILRKRKMLQEQGEEMQIEQGCFEEQYILSLLRQPKDPDKLRHFMRILSHPNMSQHSNRSAYFKTTVVQSLFSTIQEHMTCFNLCYLLYLHSVDDQNLNQRLVDRCINILNKNDLEISRKCLILVDTMTSKSKYTYGFKKFLKELPKWIEKIGFTTEIISIICNLSSLSLLADQHICIQAIEAGLLKEQKPMMFEVLNLASHLLTLRSEGLTQEQLLKIANWSLAMILLQDRHQQRQGCYNIIKLLAVSGQFINIWFLQRNLLNQIQLRISKGKASSRLLYFRILSQWLTRFPTQMAKNIQNYCPNIIYTVMDYGLGSADLNIVYEGLKIIWRMLQVGGQKDIENRNLQQLLRIDHALQTIVNRQWDQDQQISSMAQKICIGYLNDMDLQ